MKQRVLYWTCLKYSDHVFSTSNGVIPFVCPFCDTKRIRACPKDWYDTIKNNQVLAFKEYQMRNNDFSDGAYGRFLWSYHVEHNGGLLCAD